MTSSAVPLLWKLTLLIHPPKLSMENSTSYMESTLLNCPSQSQSSTLDSMMSGSLELRKLLVTILTEKSADPMASRLELGWKLREVMGALVRLLREVMTQQFQCLLKQLTASVLQVEPNANFLALGAQRETRMDNLISMFTNIFSHLASDNCRHTTTLRSWLEVIIFRSVAQSISLMVCVCSVNSWRSIQVST